MRWRSPAFSRFYIFHLNSTALIGDFASPTARHHFCGPVQIRRRLLPDHYGFKE